MSFRKKFNVRPSLGSSRQKQFTQQQNKSLTGPNIKSEIKNEIVSINETNITKAVSTDIISTSNPTVENKLNNQVTKSNNYVEKNKDELYVDKKFHEASQAPSLSSNDKNIESDSPSPVNVEIKSSVSINPEIKSTLSVNSNNIKNETIQVIVNDKKDIETLNEIEKLNKSKQTENIKENIPKDKNISSTSNKVHKRLKVAPNIRVWNQRHEKSKLDLTKDETLTNDVTLKINDSKIKDTKKIVDDNETKSSNILQNDVEISIGNEIEFSKSPIQNEMTNTSSVNSDMEITSEKSDEETLVDIEGCDDDQNICKGKKRKQNEIIDLDSGDDVLKNDDVIKKSKRKKKRNPYTSITSPPTNDSSITSPKTNDSSITSPTTNDSSTTSPTTDNNSRTMNCDKKKEGEKRTKKKVTKKEKKEKKPRKKRKKKEENKLNEDDDDAIDFEEEQPDEKEKDTASKKNNMSIERDITKLTMQELIHYRPKSFMTAGLRTKEKDPNENILDDVNDEENIDTNENNFLDNIKTKKEENKFEEEDPEEDVMAPQITINEDGEVVIDESSLTIKKKVDDSVLKSSKIIYESSISASNLMRRKYSKGRRWKMDETLRFYKALSQIGTDFTLMSQAFTDFTRNDLKKKFKQEEKINCDLVDKALENRLPLNMEMFLRRKQPMIDAVVDDHDDDVSVVSNNDVTIK